MFGFPFGTQILTNAPQVFTTVKIIPLGLSLVSAFKDIQEMVSHAQV